MQNDLITQIQSDILDLNESLVGILLKSKALAHRLGNENLKNWVRQELDGYSDTSSLPDYRRIHVIPIAQYTNGFYMQSNAPISFMNMPSWFQERAESVEFVDGVRTLESLALSPNPSSFGMPADMLILWNYENRHVLNGYECVQVIKHVPPAKFAQILETIRSRLQDLMLELTDLPWDGVSKLANVEKLDRIVQVTIFNNSGGIMTNFDQSSQSVQNQNNAGRDINVYGNVNVSMPGRIPDFAIEIQKIKTELNRAVMDNVVESEIGVDADFELATAIQEAKRAKPEVQKIQAPLNRAKDLLSNAALGANFIVAIGKLLEYLQSSG